MTAKLQKLCLFSATFVPPLIVLFLPDLNQALFTELIRTASPWLAFLRMVGLPAVVSVAAVCLLHSKRSRPYAWALCISALLCAAAAFSAVVYERLRFGFTFFDAAIYGIGHIRLALGAILASLVQAVFLCVSKPKAQTPCKTKNALCAVFTLLLGPALVLLVSALSEKLFYIANRSFNIWYSILAISLPVFCFCIAIVFLCHVPKTKLVLAAHAVSMLIVLALALGSFFGFGTTAYPFHSLRVNFQIFYLLCAYVFFANAVNLVFCALSFKRRPA